MSFIVSLVSTARDHLPLAPVAWGRRTEQRRASERTLVAPFCAVALGITTLLASSAASASLETAIAALSPGEKYRVLFVTSSIRDASSSDIDDYNTFVTTAADAGTVTGPLGLDWFAVASTGTVDAQTNTGVLNSSLALTKFFNTLGDVVAGSGADLWSGTLDSPIRANEHGSTDGFDRPDVWTGTTQAGESDPNHLGSVIPIVGSHSQFSALWVRSHSEFFGNRLHLYGISSEVEVSAAVPEPSTLSLAVLALTVLALRCRRERLGVV